MPPIAASSSSRPPPPPTTTAPPASPPLWRRIVPPKALRRARRTLLLAVPSLLLLASGYANVVVAPYTKVEESFTLQAVHDFLAFGIDRDAVEQFDHLTFPGAVPRSFLPPLLLATLTYPIALAANLLGVLRDSADLQLLVRLLLSTLHSFSLLHLILRVSPRLVAPSARASFSSPSSSLSADSVAACWILVCLTQFHINFWASRTTPNGLATPAVLLSLALVLDSPTLPPRRPGRSKEGDADVPTKGRGRAGPSAAAAAAAAIGSARRDGFGWGVSLLTATATVARLELVGLLAAVCAWGLATRRTTPTRLLKYGAAGGFGSLALSVPLDTYLWRRPFRLWNPLAHALPHGGGGLASAARGGPSSVAFGWAAGRGLLWPELEAVLFNVVEGRSVEWGVSPRWAYFTTFLPRLLSANAALVLLGALVALRSDLASASPRRDRCARLATSASQAAPLPSSPAVAPTALLALALAHVATLSALAHKEARFVAYVVPLLDGVAAVGMAWCLSMSARANPSRLPRAPPLVRRLLRAGSALFPLACLGASLLATSFGVYVSSHNYPGGEAMARLHRAAAAAAAADADVAGQGGGLSRWEPETPRRTLLDGEPAPLRVHISTLPSMTGVSLFQSVRLARPATLGVLAVGRPRPSSSSSSPSLLPRGLVVRLPSPFPPAPPPPPLPPGSNATAAPARRQTWVWEYDKDESLERDVERGAWRAWTGETDGRRAAVEPEARVGERGAPGGFDVLITEHGACRVLVAGGAGAAATTERAADGAEEEGRERADDARRRGDEGGTGVGGDTDAGDGAARRTSAGVLQPFEPHPLVEAVESYDGLEWAWRRPSELRTGGAGETVARLRRAGWRIWRAGAGYGSTSEPPDPDEVDGRGARAKTTTSRRARVARLFEQLSPVRVRWRQKVWVCRRRRTIA